MKVEIDSHSGFCFGVVSAIKTAEEELKKDGSLYCLGHIVHNEKEVERLENLGLKLIDHEDFKSLRDAKVLIRAHGEPPQTYQIAKENNITLIDATCPIVLKLQEKIKKGYESVSDKGGKVFIFGKEGHAEVVGLNGQTGGNAIVLSKFEDAKNFSYKSLNLLYSQTTMNTQDYEKLAQYIKTRAEEDGGSLKVENSICRSMSSRSEILKNFSSSFSLIVFVGDVKSSNGQYLYGICKETNANTFFVCSMSEVESLIEKIKQKTKEEIENLSIGICGATSTPMWQMEAVAKKLKDSLCF